MIFRTALFLSAMGGFFLGGPLAPAGAAGLSAAPTGEELRKFGQQFCFKCHGAEKQKGDFNFETYAGKPDVVRDRKVWEKVAELLESREMPPEEKPQPPDADRATLIHWIDGQIAQAAGQAGPGRVTLRRLNKEEYRNTIRDLLAVEFNPEDFPADETAYGFDTIADALTLPPLLMEKYLGAAETVVTKALANDKQGPPSKLVKGQQFRGQGDNVRGMDDGAMGFFREGEASAELGFEDGEYTLRFRAFGEQAGPEPPKLAVSLDGQPIGVLEVKASGRPAVYELKAQAKGGQRRLAIAYLNNYNEQNHPDPKMRGDRNAYVTSVDIVGPMHVRQQAPESFRRIFTKLPQSGEEAKVARELLGAFASKAYRRPATTQEIERLGKLADSALAQKAPFTEAVGVAVQATLCSPSFLFRWELDPAAMKPGEVRNLGDYEVASRLSYFLWNSMPDQELFDLAAKGVLLKDDNVRKQAARMLKDARGQAFVRNFSGQWLQIRALNEIEIDEKKYPKFNWQLREAMKEESRLFFDAVVREDRSIYDLVEADFTYVNQRLAELYGLPGVQGDKFQRVQLPADSPRGGVLGQAAVLMATSMPTRTSPVIRGKWVLEQLLGTPPPPPPANVPPLEATKVDKNAPLRVRLEQHRQNPDCAVCHEKIDPVGFALENFDAIGAWRTQDGTAPIDASGILPNGKKVNGVAELKQYVKGEKFARSFAQKMMVYALGRGLQRGDKAAVDAVVKQMNAGGNKMSALIGAIVTSEPFLKRQHEVAAR
jgi:hypothetical protein